MKFNIKTGEPVDFSIPGVCSWGWDGGEDYGGAGAGGDAGGGAGYGDWADDDISGPDEDFTDAASEAGDAAAAVGGHESVDESGLGGYDADAGGTGGIGADDAGGPFGKGPTSGGPGVGPWQLGLGILSALAFPPSVPGIAGALAVGQAGRYADKATGAPNVFSMPSIDVAEGVSSGPGGPASGGSAPGGGEGWDEDYGGGGGDDELSEILPTPTPPPLPPDPATYAYDDMAARYPGADYVHGRDDQWPFFPWVKGYEGGGQVNTASSLASKGRYGDTMLVHMNPKEVEGIARLSPTGSLTKNPDTGLPEAFLPMLAPLLGGALGHWAGSGGIAALSGLGSLGGMALGSGLGSFAATGDLGKGLLSGLTSFGIGSLMNSDAMTSIMGKLGGNVVKPNPAEEALKAGSVAQKTTTGTGQPWANPNIPGNYAGPEDLYSTTLPDGGLGIYDAGAPPPYQLYGGLGIYDAGAPPQPTAWNLGNISDGGAGGPGPTATVDATPKKTDGFGAWMKENPGKTGLGALGLAYMGNQMGGDTSYMPPAFRNKKGRAVPLQPGPYDPRYPTDGKRPGQREHPYFPWVRGYQEGGEVSENEQANVIITEAMMALRGEHPEPEMAVQKFIQAFGQEAFEQLRQQVLAEMQQPQQQEFAGQVTGPGGPTDDAVPAMIDGQQPAALSSGEYVLPEKTTEALGGAAALDPIVEATNGKPPVA